MQINFSMSHSFILSSLTWMLWTAYYIIHSLFDVQTFEFRVQFRNFLPQFGVLQLLEDVVDKDANECYECYGA